MKWLKDHLSEKRYIHSIGTAECARDLAKKFGLNDEKAYMAGLLHDCAKCFPNEELMAIIKEHLEVEDVELMNYKTLHAPVSAYIAKKDFGVEDEEILSAIRWHTLGRIEPKTRNKDYLEEVRDVLNSVDGLNKAMLICYKETIKSLVKRDLKICPVTIDIYNNLEDIVNVN